MFHEPHALPDGNISCGSMLRCARSVNRIPKLIFGYRSVHGISMKVVVPWVESLEYASLHRQEAVNELKSVWFRVRSPLLMVSGVAVFDSLFLV